MNTTSSGHTPPPGAAARSGPNHIMVTRRAPRASLRARVRKLIASGRWEDVHLHGLGAALAPAILLAAELVEESNGRLVASCSTSTEALVDEVPMDSMVYDNSHATASVRHNSAVHIRLSQARAANEAGLQQHDRSTKSTGARGQNNRMKRGRGL